MRRKKRRDEAHMVLNLCYSFEVAGDGKFLAMLWCYLHISVRYLSLFFICMHAGEKSSLPVELG